MITRITLPAHIEPTVRRLTTKWVMIGIDSDNFSRLVQLSRRYKFDLSAYANQITSDLNNTGAPQ
jgi:hypothetical protein